MVDGLQEKIWWDYLHEDLKELLLESTLLVKRVEKWEEKFHDYAFIVFPAAKAYEGFLKTLFLDLGFISEDDYYGKRFRIGRALNPALERHYRQREGVYDKILDFCGGRELADELWQTWKKCRNLLFHWFPNEKNAISYKDAVAKVTLVIETIDSAFAECKVDRGGE